MLIRIGIPACFRRFTAAVGTLDGAAGLVSANALFDHRRRAFRAIAPDLFSGVSMALDSAGFVGMKRYWGFPWYLDQYVDLAGAYPWDWWAAPDFCCEPEIAGDRDTVLERVRATAAKLFWARAVAEDRGIAAPLPVLQGWEPDDYLRCADLIGELPDLVGLGSMCRRVMHGPAGALAIVDRLDGALPVHVTFHLFGVKGDVASALRGHPRIASLDSVAWDVRARQQALKARRAAGMPMKRTPGLPWIACDLNWRIRHLIAWHDTLAGRVASAPPRRAPTQFVWPFLEAAE